MPVKSFGYLENLSAKSQGYRHTVQFVCAVLSPVLTKEDVLSKVSLSDCHWESVFACADGWLVMPLFYRRLCQKQLDLLCPEDFIQALRAYTDANKQRNAKHREILFETCKHLNQHGITPTLLKGAHALVNLLPDAEARILSDIDLLIPQGKVQEAEQILKEVGYYHEDDGHHHSSSSHHLDPLFHPSGDGYLELHRRPNYSDRYPHLIKYCFLESELQLHSIEGVLFYALSPEQLLIYNQIHHFHWSLGDGISCREYPDMRYLAEQAALLAIIVEAEDLVILMMKVFEDKPDLSKQQFLMLRELFDLELPDGVFNGDKSTEKAAKYSLERLLQSNISTWKYRQNYLMKILGLLATPKWYQTRLFNLKWYESRPQALKAHLRNLR